MCFLYQSTKFALLIFEDASDLLMLSPSQRPPAPRSDQLFWSFLISFRPDLSHVETSTLGFPGPCTQVVFQEFLVNRTPVYHLNLWIRGVVCAAGRLHQSPVAVAALKVKFYSRRSSLLSPLYKGNKPHRSLSLRSNRSTFTVAARPR